MVNGRRQKKLVLGSGPREMKMIEATSFKTQVKMKPSKRIGTLAGIFDRGICPQAKFFTRGQVRVQREFKDGKEVTGDEKDMSDLTGHGTLCASVLAGTIPADATFGPLEVGGTTGALPPPTVAIYKVRGKKDLEPAVLAAIEDKVRVLSISMGELPARETEGKVHKPKVPFGDEFSRVSLLAMVNNVVPCMAVGNRGSGPMENTDPFMLSCGSADSLFEIQTYLVLKLRNGKNMDIQGESINVEGTSVCELIDIEDVTIGNEDKVDASKIEGKIVVLQCNDLRDVSFDFCDARAAGLIVITKIPSSHFIYPIPAITVSIEDGENILDLMKTYKKDGIKAKAQIKQSKLKSTDFDEFPVRSFESSSSPNPLSSPFIFKEDILALGQYVLCATRQEANDQDLQSYTILNGNSLATPAVAHLIAVLRSRYPEWTAAEVKSAVITSARHPNKKGKHVAAAPGFIHFWHASNPGVLFDIDPEHYFMCLRGTPNCCPIMLSFVRGFSKSSETMDWSELNLPTFRALLPYHSTSFEFNRKFRYVGSGEEVFTPVFETDTGLELKVDPQSYRVSFRYPGEFHTFTLMARVTNWPEDNIITGLLRWKGQNKDYEITCPIVLERGKDLRSTCVDKPSASSSQREVVLSDLSTKKPRIV